MCSSDQGEKRLRHLKKVLFSVFPAATPQQTLKQLKSYLFDMRTIITHLIRPK
jgi:hypothetical protein